MSPDPLRAGGDWGRDYIAQDGLPFLLLVESPTEYSNFTELLLFELLVLMRSLPSLYLVSQARPTSAREGRVW